MKHLFFFVLIFCFSVSFTEPQHTEGGYPQGYFMSPVGRSFQLSGTFGELRPHHFHAGIDIKPLGKSGEDPIYAAAEGYVSKVRIQAGGYGRAVYIKHPNGYTTVYAHLDKLVGALADSVMKAHYEKQSFELVLEFSPTALPIGKGQQIGLMGNVGHSFGKHLHFEIRETATDAPVNPLLFGFGSPADAVKPSLNSLKLYFFDTEGNEADTRTVSIVRGADDSYHVPTDTIYIPTPSVGIALKAFDKHSGGDSGDNGIFSIEMFADGNKIYKFKAEKCPFEETRYLNAHVDYEDLLFHKSQYHRLFRLPGNMLNMYENIVNEGKINLDTDTKNISIVVADAVGNVSTLNFILKQGNAVIYSKSETYTYLLPYNKESVLKPEGAVFYFPSGSFYENIKMRFGQTTEGGSLSAYSATYHVHNNRTPVHRFYDIALQPRNLPDNLRDKAFVAYCSRENGRISNIGGKWETDGSLRARYNFFGNFCIMLDTEAPTIKPVSFSADMRKASKIAFKIYDNYEAAGEAAPLSYRAEIDGTWFLMEFDGKNDLLFHKFDGRIGEGEHQLRLVVSDNKGNEKVFEGRFRR